MSIVNQGLRITGGSRSTGLVVPTSASIPFADTAARDTWAAANLADLVNKQTIVSVVGSPNTWYLWGGDTNPSTYDNTMWIDATPAIRLNLPDDTTEGAIPVKVGGRLVDSGMIRISGGTILAPSKFGVESGSVDFGDLITLSEKGGFLGIENKQSGLSFNLIDYQSPRNSAAFRPQVFAKVEAENELVIQPVDTETITTGPISFPYTTMESAYTNALKVKVTAEMTNFRARVVDVPSGVVFKYYPSKQDWVSGTGTTIPAGEYTMDLADTPLPLTPGEQLQIEVQADNYALLGDTNGVPYMAIMKQDAEFRTLPMEGALRPLVISDSPATILPNSNVYIGFEANNPGQEFILNLADGNQNMDKIVIHYIFNAQGNTLKIRGSELAYINNNGEFFSDTELVTTSSRRLEFTWLGRWDLNI